MCTFYLDFLFSQFELVLYLVNESLYYKIKSSTDNWYHRKLKLTFEAARKYELSTHASAWQSVDSKFQYRQNLNEVIDQ